MALGDTPFLEDAHFYLAKALLRQKDVNAAQAELKAVVTLKGMRSREAQQLLNDIEKSECDELTKARAAEFRGSL